MYFDMSRPLFQFAVKRENIVIIMTKWTFSSIISVSFLEVYQLDNEMCFALIGCSQSYLIGLKPVFLPKILRECPRARHKRKFYARTETEKKSFTSRDF